MATKHTDTCLQKAGESEPIFVLRAQDQFAPIIVRRWANMAHEAGVPRDKVAEAHRCADAMLEWQEQHGAKRPD
jgi:hypothetical protein